MWPASCRKINATSIAFTRGFFFFFLPAAIRFPSTLSRVAADANRALVHSECRNASISCRPARNRGRACQGRGGKGVRAKGGRPKHSTFFHFLKVGVFFPLFFFVIFSSSLFRFACSPYTSSLARALLLSTRKQARAAPPNNAKEKEQDVLY